MIKLLIYFPFLSFLAVSENRTYTVEELCAYDEYCRYSFDEAGKVYPVKPEVRFILSNLHAEIADAGTRYGVDPRAIAGAVAAENTLNVQMSDEIQEYLAQNGVTSIAGHTFSVGIGQLKIEAAMIGEATIAKIEGRPPRSMAEVEQARLNPVEALKLIAGVMRNAQDVYQARGVDISGRPDVLTTLYNLGDVERRAGQLAPGAEPRSNYFGAFVANNMVELQDTIGWSPERGKYRPIYLNSNNYTMNRLNRGVSPMPLHSRPPTCSTQEQSTREADIARGRTFNGFRQTGQIVDQFTIIDQAIDCDMQRWVLVQTPQGANGWVKHYDLEQNAALVESGFCCGWFGERRQKRACETATNECRDKIAQITGTATTINNGLMSVIVNAPEGVTPSIKDFYAECYENQVQTNVPNTGGRNRNNGNNGYPSHYKRMNGILLRQMRERLENRKKEILSQLNLRQWSDVPADLREVFSAMERALTEAAPQTDSYSNRGTVSLVNTQTFDQMLQVQPQQAAVAAPQTPAPTNNGRPRYFGDMSGYQGQGRNNPTYTSPSQGNPYRQIIEDINYNFVADRNRVYFGGAASAPDITEIRQPLGPASAPRGIQAQEISEMVASRNEVRSAIRDVEATCKNYPSMGINMREFQPILAGASDGVDMSSIANYLQELKPYCQLYDDIASGADLSNNRNCRRSGCEMYYLDPTTNPPELRQEYIPIDYVQQNKDLLNSREVMRALGAQYKKAIADYVGRQSGNGYGNGDQERTLGCTYDPLKTLEKIEELSKLDCVGSIFVPEGDLFDGAERKSIPKVSYRPMETNDSYQLLFKSCPIDGYKEPVAETETPRPSSNAQ